MSNNVNDDINSGKLIQETQDEEDDIHSTDNINNVDEEDINVGSENEKNMSFLEHLDEMRKRHEHVESCQDSLPKALRSFFDGDSYEDVVRNAVSLGGDADTLAAIAGAMAEATSAQNRPFRRPRRTGPAGDHCHRRADAA